MAERNRGKRHHAWNAFVEVWSRRVKWAGLLILAAAIVALVIYFATSGAAGQ